MLKLTMPAQTTVEQIDKDFQIENQICAEEARVYQHVRLMCEYGALYQRYDKYCVDNNIDTDIYTVDDFQFDENRYDEIERENNYQIDDDLPF